MAKRSKKEVNEALTLAQLAELYDKQMERDSKSPGTRWSYGMELKTAMAELGAETLVSAITPFEITKFESCARVMKLKSGKPKSELSIAKTRRVLRLAVCWAYESGLIASNPYAQKDEPAAERPVKEKKQHRRRGVELEVAQPEADAAADAAESSLSPEPAA